jgi:hypothetical protein
MSTGTMTRVKARTAVEVCQQFTPGEAARALLRDDLLPGQYLDRLVAGHQFPDAVRFLAVALPKREAVWWACLCARQAHGSNSPATVLSALQAAETWAANPSEDHRRAAFVAAEAAGLGTPAGCAAVAAFWSGGSLGPPHVATIAPPEHLTARGVAGAVQLAAVCAEPERAPEKYRRFLALGKDVADGANRWPEARR